MSVLDGFYLRDNCIVTQADGDEGDSPQRTAMAHCALIMQGKGDAPLFFEAFKRWEIRPGILVRSKNPAMPAFQSDENELSRDQQDAVVAVAGMYGTELLLRHVWMITEQHLKRFFRYQNRDFANPSSVALEGRSLRLWCLWPVFWITDIFFVINSIIKAFKTDPDDVDDDNLLLRACHCIKLYPTPVSWLARRIYVWTRPNNFGNSHRLAIDDGLLPEQSAIMGAIAWKHRPSANSNRQMVEIWRPVVEKYFANDWRDWLLIPLPILIGLYFFAK